MTKVPFRARLYRRGARKPCTVVDIPDDTSYCIESSEHAERLAEWALSFLEWRIGDRLTLSDRYAGGHERYQFRVAEFAGSVTLGIPPSLRRLYR